MTLEEYQLKVPQTIKYRGYERDEMHFLCGIFTELGELLDPYKKNLCRDVPKEIDVVNLKEELGDICFYATALSLLYKEDIDIIRLRKLETDTDVIELIMSAMSSYNMVAMGQIPKERFPGLIMSIVQEIAEYYSLTLEECYDVNILKLHGVRYRDGYSDEAMDGRNTEAEYKAMQ